MKRKAKIYKGKRIVLGNKNLVTNSEIHVSDVCEDLGGCGTSEGDSGDTESVENNLPKVERAFILDLNKTYLNSQEEYITFIDNNINRFSTILVSVSYSRNRKNVITLCQRNEYNGRGHSVLGFTINTHAIDYSEDFISTILNHTIEIPIDSYYNLGKDKRIYNLPVSNTIYLLKDSALELKSILDTFNLKDGETKELTGYLIPMPCAADDYGVIKNVTKNSSDIYYYEGMRNGQYTVENIKNYLED